MGGNGIWNGVMISAAPLWLMTAPTELGSGGLQGQTADAPGSGGGAIQLAVTGTLTVNGIVTANGATSIGAANYHLSSAGSGGSIFVQAGVLAGAGRSPPTGAPPRGRWRRGGRIAVILSSANSFTGATAAYGAGPGGTAPLRTGRSLSASPVQARWCWITQPTDRLGLYADMAAGWPAFNSIVFRHNGNLRIVNG